MWATLLKFKYFFEIFIIFRIPRSPIMQNLNHIYFYAAFGKDQLKMKVTLNTSRVCVCDHGNTN